MMRRRILALVLAVATLFGVATVGSAGADTTTFSGTIPAGTIATHNVQSGAGTVTANLTCTGTGSMAIRLYDGPTNALLAQNGGSCPGTYTVSTTLATAGTVVVSLQGTPGLGYSVTVNHPAPGATTTTTAAPTTTTAPSTTTTAPATTTTAPAGTCPAPANFRATSTTSSTVSVAWDAVPGATSYDVYYAQAPDNPATVYATGFTGTTATLYSLNSGTTYKFAVRANCATGQSGNSNVVTQQPGQPISETTTTTAAPTTTTTAPSTTTTLATTTTAPSTTTTTTPTGGSVCAINPASTEAAITAAINSCPDGSASAYTVVRFPANATYTINHRVDVKDRAYLNIDLNGSRITSTSNMTTGNVIDPVILVLRGHHIQIRNGTLVGDFTAYEGQDRALGKIGSDPEFTEAMMGVGLYGTDSATLEDLKLFNHWGDGVTTGPAHYADPLEDDAITYTNNVWMSRIEVETVGRMCFGPTSGNNIWIQDSQCRDAWYGGIDAEADHEHQPLRGHHYLRNTFDGYNHFGILIPVITSQSGDWEIRDNVFLTPNDVPQYGQIQIGIYVDVTHRADNVVITGNTLPHYCHAITVDNTDGVTITGNTLTRVYKPIPGGGHYTPEGICGVGNTAPIVVTDSTNVTTSPNTIQ